jgi:hypothetical protein
MLGKLSLNRVVGLLAVICGSVIAVASIVAMYTFATMSRSEELRSYLERQDIPVGSDALLTSFTGIALGIGLVTYGVQITLRRHDRRG